MECKEKRLEAIKNKLNKHVAGNKAKIYILLH